MKLVRRLPPHIGQKVLDIGTALRLVLHYVAQRGSMRLTVASAAAAGVADISQPALFKWMHKIGPYLKSLVAGMLGERPYGCSGWGGYILIAADATTVSRPGATGTTGRLHYALHLSDLSIRSVEVTDEKIGESMRNFGVERGELWIVDRGYSNPPSVLDTVRRGADILVRLNRHSLPLYDRNGERIDVPTVLRSATRRGRAHNLKVRVIAADGGQVNARLCWMWLPKEDAAKARTNATRGGASDEQDLSLAEYVAVVTTAPSSKLTESQVLELYRARWQIELDFKRDKTIGELDQLPTELPQTIQSWLYAKVLLDLIARRFVSQSVAIPPCGLAEAILPLTSRAAVVRPRRRALVRHATRLASAAHGPHAHHAA